MITIKDTQIFPGHHVPSQNDVWKCSNCKVLTATPLIWSLHKENLNNVLLSSPWSALSCLCWLPSAAIWAAGWLRPRPIPAACGLGRLPAVPTDMCSSKRWMNNGAVQPGGFFFILSQTSVCMEPLQSPTQQVSSPKSCATTRRNTDVQIRFRRLKCVGMNNLAVVEAQNAILGSCLDTIWVIGVRQR